MDVFSSLTKKKKPWLSTDRLQRAHYKININYLQLIKSASGDVCHFNQKRDVANAIWKWEAATWFLSTAKWIWIFPIREPIFQDLSLLLTDSRHLWFEVKREQTSDCLQGGFSQTDPWEFLSEQKTRWKQAAVSFLVLKKKKTIYRIFSLWICIMPCSHSPSLQGELDFCLIEQTVICSSVFFSRCDRK